ncbi:MAG: copper chaperone PCu(A)C [Pseudonocardiaceae bacterium]
MRVPLTIAARIVACFAAALALAGCGAGQIAQTDSQVAAVDGAFGNVGNSIALRNVLLPYPPSPTGTYPAGSTVPVVLAIVNQGDQPDELVAVTSPAGQAQVLGATQIPGGTTVISTAGSAEPTSPLVVGELRILLSTTQPLRAGLTMPITFQFRDAGTLTLPVPMATPPNAAG